MPTPLRVHLIANAHLDPVWCWPWQQGSDESLATCRSACDLLDDHPDVFFTRGEAWVYEQIRTLDPDLFERVRRHVQAGRWEVVNGWWVQADANLPTAEALLKSAALGQAWFREHLGLPRVPVAYLVDSFGHGAFLPRLIRQAGQDYYVMMRPSPWEKELPSSLFRWRSPDGAEVLTFRIGHGYNCNTAHNRQLAEHIAKAVEQAPPGVGHVMCFYGVGDHGGGPTREAVRWIREHRDFAPGVQLEFSTTTRFFAAVEAKRDTVPVVTGELQMHAIGCYSVCGALKRSVRRAEHAALDAETLLRRADPAATQAESAEIDAAWRTLCFNQFHDILPGSAIREAVDTAQQQVGGAADRLDRVTHTLLRRHLAVARRCALTGHRFHAVNRLDRPWRGLAEAEVWLDWQAWAHHLEDEQGRVISCQAVQPACLMVECYPASIPRLLWPLDLAAGTAHAFRIVEGPAEEAGPIPYAASCTANALDNGRVRVRFGSAGIAQISDLATGQDRLAEPLELLCFEDLSDTWSHGLDRFAGPLLATAEFGPPQVVEPGPFRARVRLDGRIGDSPCRLFVHLIAGETAVHARLAVNYRQPMSVLKARIAPAGGLRNRQDRVAGGWHARALDEREYPAHHALTAHTPRGPLGLAFPDSFALDASAAALRPTLIRNNLNAMNNSQPTRLADHPRLQDRFGSDEGLHELRWDIAVGDAASSAGLEALLDQAQRPPFIWDDFRAVSRVQRWEAPA